MRKMTQLGTPDLMSEMAVSSLELLFYLIYLSLDASVASKLQTPTGTNKSPEKNLFSPIKGPRKEQARKTESV